MAQTNVNREGVFVDTVAWIALMSPNDQHYANSTRLFAQARRQKVPLCTTSAVLIEVLDGAAERDRRMSSLLRRLLEGFDVEMVHVDELLLEHGWNLYDARPDKSWSLTDCVSFSLMKQRGLFQSLTYDHHFEQAGFGALLHEPKI